MVCHNHFWQSILIVQFLVLLKCGKTILLQNTVLFPLKEVSLDYAVSSIMLRSRDKFTSQNNTWEEAAWAFIYQYT